jgi:hypothetical protein
MPKMLDEGLSPHRNHLALEEPSVKTMLGMLDRHIAYLEAVSAAIRRRRCAVVSRAAIIRALIEFMQRSGIDFSRFGSADEMVPFLVELFRAAQTRRREEQDPNA